MTLVSGLPEYYFAFRMATRTVATGYDVPVSTSWPDANPWRYVPWDQHIDNPSLGEDPNSPGTVTVGGWTFLYGPCWFSISASMGWGNVQPHSSTHFQPVAVEGADSTVIADDWEGWEEEVFEKETHTCHFFWSGHGYLKDGHRLRMRCDLWHATAPAKLYRARVQGTYKRLPA